MRQQVLEVAGLLAPFAVSGAAAFIPIGNRALGILAAFLLLGFAFVATARAQALGGGIIAPPSTIRIPAARPSLVGPPGLFGV